MAFPMDNVSMMCGMSTRGYLAWLQEAILVRYHFALHCRRYAGSVISLIRRGGIALGSIMNGRKSANCPHSVSSIILQRAKNFAAFRKDRTKMYITCITEPMANDINEYEQLSHFVKNQALISSQ